MSWIETKLCRIDKDLTFYEVLQLILPKSDSSSFELQLFVAYKIRIQNTLEVATYFEYLNLRNIVS